MQSAPDGVRRYTGVAQLLHWLVLVLVLAVLPLAWVAESLPKGALKSSLFVLHRSVGLTIWLLIVARLAWRARHPAPAPQDGAARWVQLAGDLSAWLLYLLFFLMPVSGYLMSGNGKPVSYFGVFYLPGFPRNAGVDDVANALHLAGQWAVYALVALHILAVVWHVALRRDGVLERMLPLQRVLEP